MMGFSLDSSRRVLLLLWLLAALCLHHQDFVSPVLAAPIKNDLPPEGKLPLLSASTMIKKTEAISSVSRRGGGGGGGGGGGHGGGGGRGGGGRGGEGARRGGPGSMIPIYAGGAAGAGARGHHNGAGLNRGKPSPRQSLGLAAMLALPMLFNYFA